MHAQHNADGLSGPRCCSEPACQKALNECRVVVHVGSLPAACCLSRFFACCCSRCCSSAWNSASQMASCRLTAEVRWGDSQQAHSTCDLARQCQGGTAMAAASGCLCTLSCSTPLVALSCSMERMEAHACIADTKDCAATHARSGCMACLLGLCRLHDALVLLQGCPAASK